MTPNTPNTPHPPPKKVGDAISCFVLSVEDSKVSLTQDLDSLGLDGALDEEGEDLDYEEERLLAQADGVVGFFGVGRGVFVCGCVSREMRSGRAAGFLL